MKYPSIPSSPTIRVFARTTLILGLLGTTLLAHPKSSLLWKIFGNGLKAPSYLYGTVHSFDKRAFGFAKLAGSYIGKCESFGMEINMENLGDVNIFSMMKYLTMPGDTTLEMLMTPEQYAKLGKFVSDSMHLALAMFDRIKPMFLLGMQEGMSMSEDSSVFLDQYLMNKAKEAEKVYKDDLIWNPGNGWSLLGMYQSLTAQNKETEAAACKVKYTKAFEDADVDIKASVF